MWDDMQDDWVDMGLYLLPLITSITMLWWVCF